MVETLEEDEMAVARLEKVEMALEEEEIVSGGGDG